MFSTDAASDAIAHFIGLFELADLRARLRLDYDDLTARPQTVETGPVAMLDLAVPHPYLPRDFGPQLHYQPPAPDLDTVWTAAQYDYLPVRASLPVPMSDPGPLPGPDATGPAAALMAGPVVPQWHLQPPGSVAVAIVQHNTLHDDDWLNAQDMVGAVAPQVLLAQVDALVQTATALGIAPGLALPAGEADFHSMAARLGDAIAGADRPAAPNGAEVFTHSGADAAGQHLNGAADATLPPIDDLLPAGWTDAHPRLDSPQTDGPAHQIVHGANMLLNEVVLTASWISAPVLAVAGASYAFDLISQVNVWQDVDTVTGVVGGLAGALTGGTQGFNLATLTHAAAPLPVVAEADAAGPQFWATTTIEGSLINFNWVEQQNFVTDNDVTSITLQGAQTTMVFGANQAANQTSLIELGSRFDLIVVDGHLINLSAITQTNVLLDSDDVTLHDDASVSTGDNLLVNDATILHAGQTQHTPLGDDFAKVLTNGTDDIPSDVRDDPAFAGLDVLRVLHVKGDLVSAQIIEQMNILGDADQVDVLAARAMENAGDVSVVTGSNVLINAAHVAQFGVDSTIHTGGGVYSDALLHQAQLIDTDNPFSAGSGGAFAAAGGLASEAVAFLADGMTGGPGDFDAPFLTAPHAGGDIYSPDPMHTVVA